MRHIGLLLSLFVGLNSIGLIALAEADSDGRLELFQASEIVRQEVTESVGHLVVLASLKKVNHELQPETSVLISGTKDASTYYLPHARRTTQVADHFKEQLNASAELLFECKGRSCGSSSYWANKIFKQAILYGPEQYQYYLVAQQNARGADEGDYIVIYIGERATRKIYVHIEYISKIPS